MEGTIASLQPERGFGFITANGEEFFFHRSALLGIEFDELAEGLMVEFQPEWGAPGDKPGEEPRAVSVRLADFEMPAVDNELLPPEKSA
jgi:cold shock CspA family protein